MSTQRSICTFHLESLYLGVDVLFVQEVIRHQKMTEVPLAPSSVRGLMNLRGQIVTALDLRQQLGLPEFPETATPMNVVVRADDGPVSLLVDRIGDVVSVDDSDCEAPPDTLASELRDLVEYVYKLDAKLLLTLNVHKLLTMLAAA